MAKIKGRLRAREWDESLINDNVALDGHLRWMMLREPDSPVVDTGTMTKEASAEILCSWIHGE